MLDPVARHDVKGLAERIKARREALDLTQSEVGKRMKPAISDVQVSNYESGRRSPSAKSLRDLALALECSADYLLGLSPIVAPGAAKKQRTPFPLPDLGRPLTPLPGKVDPLESLFRQAEAQGIGYVTMDGKPYRKRKGGWEPV